MKKLLILMLVLGFASSASALLVTLEPVNPGTMPGTLTVNVVSDSAELPYTYAVEITNTTNANFVSAPTATAAAGTDSALTDYADALGAGTYTYLLETADMSDPFDSVQPGVQWTFDIDITATPPGAMLLLLDADADLAEVGSYELTGVPEPMTIALLGLGGLFLLRRRK